MKHLLQLACVSLSLALTAPAHAELDLNRVAVTRLDNGMTLLVLEDHTLPVVSLQMVYKVGGRDDPEGRMGIAHFFEHMAFRSSKNFPGTGLVSNIYAIGGEWHGYTWIDQTTYFSTAPKENLDLLLRIESDRMNNLDMDPNDVKAEFGAVLTEMNSYENDPFASLYDAVTATMYQAHPYGKNTIGYEADIAAVTHEDLVSFYEKHIRPNKAVLAVVGDVNREDVARRVEKLFGKAKPGEPVALPPASEPYLPGEKRTRVNGVGTEKFYQIAYPAPAASSPDFAAFLLLQEAASGGSGINFRQNDWGTPSRADSAMGKAVPGASTFFIASAQPYLFVVSGSIGAKGDEAKVESGVQKTLDAMAAAPVSAEALAAARKGVARELALDLETTEDAAHQLAIFEGIGALDQLIDLPARLAAVTPADIQRVAKTYLNKDRRTIGWYAPVTDNPPALPPTTETLALAAPRPGAPAPNEPMPAPQVSTLENGAALIVQHSLLSPTAYVKLAVPGLFDCDTCSLNDPMIGYTSIAEEGVSDSLASLVADAKAALVSARPHKASAPDSDDPATRIEQVLTNRFAFSGATANAPARASLVIISGDVDAGEAANLASGAFGAGPAPAAPPSAAPSPSTGAVTAAIADKKSQTALGYMVPAPAMNAADALAWRLALYVLSHHYEGRLGAEAISNRGLVYYIGAKYRASPTAGLITLQTGVDPDKQGEMRDLMKSEIARLLSEPPSEAEFAEAKRHLIGRRISAAQSNDEIAESLSLEWLAFGALRSVDDFAATVNAVTLDDVKAVLPAFVKGDIVTVTVGE